jgi:hypothetical protein
MSPTTASAWSAVAPVPYWPRWLFVLCVFGAGLTAGLAASMSPLGDLAIDVAHHAAR